MLGNVLSRSIEQTSRLSRASIGMPISSLFVLGFLVKGVDVNNERETNPYPSRRIPFTRRTGMKAIQQAPLLDYRTSSARNAETFNNWEKQTGWAKKKKKREQSRFETNLDTHSRGDATRPRDSIDRSSSIQVSRFTRSLPFQSVSVFPPCSKGVGSRDNFLGDREDRSRVVVPGESFARWNATRTTLASVTRVGGYKLRFYRS